MQHEIWELIELKKKNWFNKANLTIKMKNKLQNVQQNIDWNNLVRGFEEWWEK